MERRREREHGGEPLHGNPEPSGYEPPRVERVLGPEELKREVLYAGPPASADAIA